MQTKKLTFSPTRFLGFRMYRQTDLSAILNPNQLESFVAKSLDNPSKDLFWSSLKDK